MRSRLVRMFRIALAVAALSAVTASCGGTSSNTSTTERRGLFYLALGDSWPEGAHCGGCRTFAALYADGLRKQTRSTVHFEDDTGQAQPYFEELGGGSASLLKALRTDDETRGDVANADVIMIATGPNEIDDVVEPVKAGRCGGRDDRACYRRLDRKWRRNFDAILEEIEKLRAGKQTAIRLVDAANPFVSVPEMSQGLPEGYAGTGGARIFELLNDALCDAAERHDAVCVDVRPVLNGKSLKRAVDENSSESMRAVANALLATGS